MVNDLSDLFGAVDAAQVIDDLKEYGVIAASAVASSVGFGMAAKFALSKWATAPAWVSKYAVPGAAIMLGAVGAGYVSRYNRQVGLGMGVGLVSYGLTALAKQFMPGLPLQGFADLGDSALLDAGNPYGRYLQGATTTVETVNGLNGATTTVETVNGFGAMSIESSSMSPQFAAVLQ